MNKKVFTDAGTVPDLSCGFDGPVIDIPLYEGDLFSYKIGVRVQATEHSPFENGVTGRIVDRHIYLKELYVEQYTVEWDAGGQSIEREHDIEVEEKS